MSNASITSRDPRGQQAVSIFESAYNKANLDAEGAQRINERGDELKQGISRLLTELSVSDRYADEEVLSNFTYMSSYEGPHPIKEQVEDVATIFSLDSSHALRFVESLPSLPEGAEEWFAIPTASALAPEVDDLDEQYCNALKLVLDRISSSRSFKNWLEGYVMSQHLRVHHRTMQALASLEESQKGDILVVPAQLGARHRGRSVRRARELFASSEFGLTSLAVGSIILTHPSRLTRWDELDMDCAGDEFDHPVSGARFDLAPVFRFDDGRVHFVSGWHGLSNGLCGSASGFLPQ